VIETVAPLPSLRHLARLPDAVGIFKHAKLDCPRLECGYCTDDAGRLLAIASRLARDSKAPLLAEVALFPLTGSSWPGAGSVCRRVLMALGRTISSPGAGTRSPRRSLLQRWMFEAEVRGLAEGHEGSIAQVRPRCRCRRRRSETEQSPAGSVVAGERPFDRFRRGTNQAGGHGLGLSIAVPPVRNAGVGVFDCENDRWTDPTYFDAGEPSSPAYLQALSTSSAARRSIHSAGAVMIAGALPTRSNCRSSDLVLARA